MSRIFINKALLFSCILGSLTLSSNAQKEAQAPTPAATPTPDPRGYLVKVGDPAPDDFTLKLTDGTTTTLKALKGKVVVLQFTASWCEVCREEMPHLEADVWKANKDKNFILIAVDRDQPLDTVKRFKKEMQLTYPFALDPGANIFGRFSDKNSGVTRNVVIDRDGKIAFLTRLYTPEEFSVMVKVINGLVNRS
jgi:peroxiredoxin